MTMLEKILSKIMGRQVQIRDVLPRDAHGRFAKR